MKSRFGDVEVAAVAVIGDEGGDVVGEELVVELALLEQPGLAGLDGGLELAGRERGVALEEHAGDLGLGPFAHLEEDDVVLGEFLLVDGDEAVVEALLAVAVLDAAAGAIEPRGVDGGALEQVDDASELLVGEGLVAHGLHALDDGLEPQRVDEVDRAVGEQLHAALDALEPAEPVEAADVVAGERGREGHAFLQAELVADKFERGGVEFGGRAFGRRRGDDARDGADGATFVGFEFGRDRRGLRGRGGGCRLLCQTDGGGGGQARTRHQGKPSARGDL